MNQIRFLLVVMFSAFISLGECSKSFAADIRWDIGRVIENITKCDGGLEYYINGVEKHQQRLSDDKMYLVIGDDGGGYQTMRSEGQKKASAIRFANPQWIFLDMHYDPNNHQSARGESHDWSGSYKSNIRCSGCKRGIGVNACYQANWWKLAKHFEGKFKIIYDDFNVLSEGDIWTRIAIVECANKMLTKDGIFIVEIPFFIGLDIHNLMDKFDVFASAELFCCAPFGRVDGYGTHPLKISQKSYEYLLDHLDDLIAGGILNVVDKERILTYVRSEVEFNSLMRNMPVHSSPQQAAAYREKASSHRKTADQVNKIIWEKVLPAISEKWTYGDAFAITESQSPMSEAELQSKVAAVAEHFYRYTGVHYILRKKN